MTAFDEVQKLIDKVKPPGANAQDLYAQAQACASAQSNVNTIKADLSGLSGKVAACWTSEGAAGVIDTLKTMATNRGTQAEHLSTAQGAYQAVGDAITTVQQQADSSQASAEKLKKELAALYSSGTTDPKEVKERNQKRASIYRQAQALVEDMTRAISIYDDVLATQGATLRGLKGAVDPDAGSVVRAARETSAATGIGLPKGFTQGTTTASIPLDYGDDADDIEIAKHDHSWSSLTGHDDDPSLLKPKEVTGKVLEDLEIAKIEHAWDDKTTVESQHHTYSDGVATVEASHEKTSGSESEASVTLTGGGLKGEYTNFTGDKTTDSGSVEYGDYLGASGEVVTKSGVDTTASAAVTDDGFNAEYSQTDGKSVTASGQIHAGPLDGSGSVAANAGLTKEADVKIGKDGMDAHAGVEYGASASADGQVKAGALSASGSASADAGVGADANAHIGKDGVNLGADVHAGVEAKAEGEADLGPGSIGGSAEGEAGAEAHANMSIDDHGAHAEAGAMAGARVAGDLHGDVGGVGAGVHGEAWAGVGAEAKLDFGPDKNGEWHIGGSAGAGLGVGGKVGFEVTVDPGEVVDTADKIGDAIGGLFDGTDKAGSGVSSW